MLALYMSVTGQGVWAIATVRIHQFNITLSDQQTGIAVFCCTCIQSQPTTEVALCHADLFVRGGADWREYFLLLERTLLAGKDEEVRNRKVQTLEPIRFPIIFSLLPPLPSENRLF